MSESPLSGPATLAGPPALPSRSGQPDIQPNKGAGKPSRIGAWIALIVGALYFILPLAATVDFSLKMRRGVYSFDAYRAVFADPQFQASFGYSVMMGIFAIVLGVLLVVPTAYLVQLKLPKLRPLIEFITLLPLVIPAIVIVFGYLHVFNSSSFLPLTGNERATDFLLVCGYVTLCLPYMYRSVDAALRAIDVRSLTEAAECLGANWITILFRVIFPNVRSGILSGAFLTFAVVIGEFTMASLLNRPSFGPYLQLIGANQAYQPSALAIIAFAITWASMGLIQLFGSARANTRPKS
jgi:putative spermidine/putrescine transport system permease protein